MKVLSKWFCSSVIMQLLFVSSAFAQSGLGGIELVTDSMHPQIPSCEEICSAIEPEDVDLCEHQCLKGKAYGLALELIISHLILLEQSDER